MNYFRKTKFRETSLIFVGIFIAIIYFTISDSSEEQGKAVQEIMDARVEEAVEEALKEATTTTLPNNTTTTTNPYPNQYDSIRIGYVLDVRLNDIGKVRKILINNPYFRENVIWVSTDSSVQLYRFNKKSECLWTSILDYMCTTSIKLRGVNYFDYWF